MDEFANDLFVAESSVRFYGFRIQTRMAVVRLGGNRLFLYSPVSLTRRLRDEIARLGEVAFIVSPNKIHNLTLAQYREAFPAAKLLVPPGFPERRPDLRVDGVLYEQALESCLPELEHVLTGGNVFFSEALFSHRPSRTLLVGDFVEKIGPGIVSPAARATARLFGVRQPAMASPEFRFYTSDAKAFAQSIEPLRAWPIKRIFVCHGDLIESGGDEVVREVSDALIHDVRSRSRLMRALFVRLARWQ